MFKKAIKANSETMEVDIIKLFGFIIKDNIYEWGETMFKTIQVTLLKSWNKHFVNNLKL